MLLQLYFIAFLICNLPRAWGFHQRLVPRYPSPRSWMRNAEDINSHKMSPRLMVTELGMAKKLRNKQIELAKKLALAKEQNSKVDPSGSADEERLSDQEMKERNDRRRFEEILKNQPFSTGDASSDGYLSRSQEEAEIDAYQRGLDRLFEGDPAPNLPFQELIDVKTENAIGEAGMRRLVPWLGTSGKTDYLVIICDPRAESPELRETVSMISSGLNKDLLSNLIVVNADTPAENRRWLKKSNLSEITVYSDEKREWMTAYTALGEERWSISMFVISDERLQKIGRELDSVFAVKAITNAVKEMKQERL